MLVTDDKLIHITSFIIEMRENTKRINQRFLSNMLGPGGDGEDFGEFEKSKSSKNI